MKYHVSFLIFLILVHPSCSPKRSDQPRQQTAQPTANELTLSLGMSHELALEIIRECGGKDVTAGQAMMGLNGERPLSGLFWSLEQYDSVLQIAAEDGKLVVINYWTGADYSTSKLHRVKSMRNLKSLTFEKQTRTVKTQLL